MTHVKSHVRCSMWTTQLAPFMRVGYMLAAAPALIWGSHSYPGDNIGEEGGFSVDMQLSDCFARESVVGHW